MSEKEKSIGALWQKQGERGVYMTGVIEVDGKQVKLVVFPNSYKKEQKHPDWRIFLSQPREQQVQTPMSNEQPEIDVSDIPF